MELKLTLAKRFTSRYTKQYLAGIISNIGVFCFGTALGWTCPAEHLIREHNAYDFQPTSVEWHWICCLLPLGAVISCLPMGILMKFWGCKFLMYLQIIPYMFGWCFLIFAQNSYMLLLGRFLQGICGAAVCVAVPVYCDEMSLDAHRGLMGSLFFGALYYGVLWSTILIEVCGVKLVNTLNLLLILLCIMLIIIPESPSYYISRDDEEAAEKSLKWLRGSDFDSARECELIRESQLPAGWWKILNKKSLFSIPRISILLILHQVCGGILIVIYLKDTLHIISRNNYMVDLMLVLLFVICGHLVCLFLVDRVGRRPLLCVSLVGMNITAIFLCIWMKWAQPTDSHQPPTITLFLFIGFFSFGVGPISWILYVELVISPVRALGCSIAAFCGWLTIILSINLLSFSVSYLRLFYFIEVGSILAFLFVALYLPETKGRTSSQIQYLLSHQAPLCEGGWL